MSRKYATTMPTQPTQPTQNQQTATQQVAASQQQETPSKLTANTGVAVNSGGAVAEQTIPPVSSVGGQAIQAVALPRSVDKYADMQVTLAGTTTLELTSIERKFTGWN